MCASMKPGTTSRPPASMTRARPPARFMTSALEPTAAMRSPVVNNASAHRRWSSPVQTRALTTASASPVLEVAETDMVTAW